MKLTPINTIYFGYSKKLSNQLNGRLDRMPSTPVTDMIAGMNSMCNSVESRIIQLENYDNGGITRNEEEINILLSGFLDMKRNLCALVDRIFPDLNFSRRTIDKLDEESNERDAIFEDTAENTDHISYRWRHVLRERVDKDVELKEKYDAIYGDWVNSEVFTNPKASGVGVGLGEDGRNLLTKFEPSSSSPKSLDDVVGLDHTISDIKDLILFPLQNPAEAQIRQKRYGIKVPNFSVLYGPPGCGKTMIAEAISAQTGCEMYKLDLTQVGSTYVNGTVINIAKAFEEVSEIADKSEKSILLFMDEMDSLLSKRGDSGVAADENNKVVNALLQLIVGMKDKNVLIMGATNMHGILDGALKDRINYEAYIGLPKQEDMKEIVKRQLLGVDEGLNLSGNEEALDKIAKTLTGYTPRSVVEKIFPQVCLYAYRNDREIIESDFETVIKNGDFEKVNERDYLPQDKKNKKAMGFKYST